MSDSPDDKSLKRKADGPAEQPALSKRAQKRLKRKNPPKNVQQEEVDTESGINEAIGKMDRSLLADYVAKQISRFEPDLSDLEVEERRISESAFVDTSSWTQKRDLDGLPAFLEHYSGKSKSVLSTAPKPNGSPHTIVVAAAGLRSADLIRSLRVFQTTSGTVAKLFAKHIKLKDAVTTTKNTRMNIGIGTPKRLLDLIEQDSLSLQFVERILIDASHVDAKKRGILNMEETEVPLTRLLAIKELKERYSSQAQLPIKILVY